MTRRYCIPALRDQSCRRMIERAPDFMLRHMVAERRRKRFGDIGVLACFTLFLVERLMTWQWVWPDAIALTLCGLAALAIALVWREARYARQELDRRRNDLERL